MNSTQLIKLAQTGRLETTTIKAVIYRAEFVFQKNVGCHIYYQNPVTKANLNEQHKGRIYRDAWALIETLDCFTFRIDRTASAKKVARIKAKIESLGFQIKPSDEPHYDLIASR